MRLEERKEDILDFIIRDYIKTAIPVSSQKISEESAVEASPATIRNTMLELDEEGYLLQPHTSAGRIPSETGYRYFVKYLMEERNPSPAAKEELDMIVERFSNDTNTLFDQLSKMFARELKLFSGASVVREHEQIFSSGLSQVFQEPEFSEHKETVRFGKFLDHIDEELAELYQKNASGGSSQIVVNSFGLVTARFQNDHIGECIMFSLGPQRMNYEKASSLLKYAVDDLTNMTKL